MHIDFDLSNGEDQDLNFNVTTGGAQDEAKLLSKKCAGAPSQQKSRGPGQIGRILRSLSCQPQMPETINCSRLIFFQYIPTSSFEVARMFLSKTFQ